MENNLIEQKLIAQIELEVERLKDAVKDKKILQDKLNRALEFIDTRVCCKDEAREFAVLVREIA